MMAKVRRRAISWASGVSAPWVALIDMVMTGAL
jgi:hypothetical protein